MPNPSKFPRISLPPTVWNSIEAEAQKRAATGNAPILLHVGDTYLPFQDNLITQAKAESAIHATQLNRYSNTSGELELRKMVLAKVKQKNSLPSDSIDHVQITCGATGALEGSFARLLDIGAEVLTPSPYWSILRQVADHARVKLVEVPFFDKLANDPKFDLVAALSNYITPKTQGIYINTPSNPTGIILSRKHLDSIARFARENDLWIFSDEAYENFIWEDSEHISIGSLPDMYERTVSIFTFSKCFGASGMRVGYVAAPTYIISQVNRSVVGSYYQTGRLGQLYAWRGMNQFTDIVNKFRNDYFPTWKWVKENLAVESFDCRAGFYFFVRVREDWYDISPEEQISLMINAGVVLAPGQYFGADYHGWARLCFTVVPPNDIKQGIQRLNNLMRKKGD